jgi:sugar (pentulose or hexulose) kinase
VLEDGGTPLSGADRRRVVLEGLVFRVREILEDLCQASPIERVLVSGGLSAEPFVPSALAAALGAPVEVLEEEETSLLGAARLAAGLEPCARPRTRIVPVPPRGAWLRAKHVRWRAWMAGVLGPGHGPP